jgi:hypothetical protein
MDTIVRTFDLYNTTFYWKGYNVPNFASQLSVSQAFYAAQFSSNPIGSQIDFFTQLASGSADNPSFNLAGINLKTLPYLWSKYWWDEAMYYSNNTVTSILLVNIPTYYHVFSESVGSLYYVSYKPYNTLTERLILPGVSQSIHNFYTKANNLFTANISNIGPTVTDTAPGNLTPASTDLNRRINCKNNILNGVNSLYPVLSRYLPFNNNVVGNLITPYSWFTTIEYEDMSTIGDTNISVDITNTTTSTQTQLTTNTLKA